MENESAAFRGRMMLTTKMRSPEGLSASEKHAYGCRIEDNADSFAIAWHECAEGSDADIRFSVQKNEAVMHRTGDTAGDLRFVPGTKQPGLYHTPYGSFQIVTDTHGLTHFRDEKGGVIRLRYDLWLEGQISSTTELELTWRR